MFNLLRDFLLEDDAEAESRALTKMRSEHPELPDWSGAVQPVLDRLLRENGISRALVCRVLSGMPFNALALPHKTVVIAEQLVDFCRGQTPQMAFVVAHEVSHIYRRHARGRSRAGAVTGLLATNPLFALGVRTLLDLGCSRENEFEADRDALTFCHRAGYAVEGGVEFLERLSRGEVPPGELRQLLNTHPPLTERLAELRTCAAGLRSGPA
ncbi:MAG TPA: M48 family metalloprotease [Gemmata sp.]